MIIPKVKICGITNYEDAHAAVDLGADILGFNFFPESVRYIHPEVASKIIKRLPAFVDLAAIFVNASLEKIKNAIDMCQLNWVQLHGDETNEFCEILSDFNVKTIKATRVQSKEDIENAYMYNTDAILLDAFVPKHYGGTGQKFDWSIIGKEIDKRIFLAGGINPENAREAVELGVYGIDVCSGVESKPGKKDYNKMKALFDNIALLRA